MGEIEGREGRGDLVQEAAQVILVLTSLVHLTHPDADLVLALSNEASRLGLDLPTGTAQIMEGSR